MKLLKLTAGLGMLGIIGFLVVTAPEFYALARGRALTGLDGTPDIANGKAVFHAGGCSSCHATEKQPDKTRLGGGHALKVPPFGIFNVPNISPHPADGIGNWTVEQFARAMVQGVSPDGRHYYPAFPYTSYQRMSGPDLRDLLGYLKSLPAVEGRIRDHELAFPVNIRRSLGGWKLLFLDGKAFQPDPAKSASWNRGAYLADGAGHCAECHSPRNVLGVIQSGRRFSGGPDAERKGFVPNITPHETGIKTWSKGDIDDVLSTGLTPSGDFIGGVMAPVTRNFAELPKEDRLAVAEYLLSLPPLVATKKP